LANFPHKEYASKRNVMLFYIGTGAASFKSQRSNHFLSQNECQKTGMRQRISNLFENSKNAMKMQLALSISISYNIYGKVFISCEEKNMNARLFFKKFFCLLFAVVSITILLAATNVLAAAGALDPNFGSNGVVKTKHNGMPSSAWEVVLQTDGKIITLGTVKLSADQTKRVITRYNSNGSVDTSFGTNGSTLIEIVSCSGSKIALQPDGKLIVAGLSQRGFAAVRYNSNGSLDTSFGANGLAALNPVNTSSDIYYFVEDVTIQPDGKIVMAGSYSIGNHIEFEVVRFNSDGTRDVINSLDWGTLGNQYNYGKAVTIQPDNKIVMSGDMVSCCDSYHYISLARFDPNVLLDRSTFSSGRGAVTARLNYFQHSSGALALQADGKIVVAGSILGMDWKTPQNLALARFNSDGTLDTAFGGTGIVVTDFGAEESTANLVIQASGKIILAGTTSSAGASDFLLVRYNSDGSLDSSFGTNGKVVTDFGSATDTATGIVQQTDGKVIVIGTSGDNAILARYDTGMPTATTTLTFNSVGAYDGWILESGENSSKGGTLDKISNVF